MIKRDLVGLCACRYDLVIVGGGITGAAIAWDASLRGLKVALIERQDFGAATSANSLKTVHGGLRYLQDGSFRLVRTMMKERQALLRIAPHLVHPLPVIMCTLKNELMRSKLLLGTAVRFNDMLCFDRNTGMGPSHSLPDSRILSRQETEGIITGIDGRNLTGSVLWYDAQVYNTERLLLSFVLSAAGMGARVANYVRATGFLRKGNSVSGITATDELTGNLLEIQGQMVVNAAGPWVDELLSELGAPDSRAHFTFSTAMNLVTRQILPDYAMGLTSYYAQPLPDGSTRERSRVLFIAPWRNYSLVGTLHAPYDGCPGDRWVTERAVIDFIDELNRAYPGARLRRSEVYRVHQGLLPMTPKKSDPMAVKLLREGKMTDHSLENGIDGLITAVGVKYTSARYLAQKTVDLVFKKLKRNSPVCRTRQFPLFGGNISHYESYAAGSIERWPVKIPLYQVKRLIRNYGSDHFRLLPYFMMDENWREPVSADAAITRAEVLYAVREEMAEHLSDVLMRRTEMGSACMPDQRALEETASIMAKEKGWDRMRIRSELDNVCREYSISENG